MGYPLYEETLSDDKIQAVVRGRPRRPRGIAAEAPDAWAGKGDGRDKEMMKIDELLAYFDNGGSFGDDPLC